MTINTAEIEARLSRLNVNGIKGQEGDYHALLHHDLPDLLAALEAETARADDLQKDAVRLVQEKMNVIEQLTAANEKLAAADGFANTVHCLIFSMVERGVTGDDLWWGQDFMNVRRELESIGRNCDPNKAEEPADFPCAFNTGDGNGR